MKDKIKIITTVLSTSDYEFHVYSKHSVIRWSYRQYHFLLIISSFFIRFNKRTASCTFDFPFKKLIKNRAPSSPIEFPTHHSLTLFKQDKSSRRIGQDSSRRASSTASTPFIMMLFSTNYPHAEQAPAIRSSWRAGKYLFIITVLRELQPPVSMHMPERTRRRSRGVWQSSKPSKKPASISVE